MPQTQSVSDTSVNAFLSLDEAGQRKALASMSPETKQALLTVIRNLSDPERGAAQATGLRPETTKGRIKSLALEAGSFLPSVGGGAGGALGTMTSGPFGGVAGATLGGTIGKLGEQAIEHGVFGMSAPPSPLSAAVGSGLEQGALEAGGQVLARGAKALATAPAAERFAARPLNRMMRVPSEAFAEPGAETMSPGIALARQPGVPVTTGQYGMRRYIANRITSLTAARDAIATQLTQRGVTVDLQTPVSQALQKAARVPKEFEERKLVKALTDLETRLTTKAVPGAFIDQGGRAVPLRASRGLEKTTLADAIEYRQDLDEMIGQYQQDPANKFKKALEYTRARVNDAIHKAAPQIADHDQQIHQLIYGREGMGERIAHLERGTPETGRGSLAGRLASKLPTRTVPWQSASAKARRAAVKAGSTPGKRTLIRQVPRALAEAGGMNPPPEVDDEQQ